MKQLRGAAVYARRPSDQSGEGWASLYISRTAIVRRRPRVGRSAECTSTTTLRLRGKHRPQYVRRLQDIGSGRVDAVIAYQDRLTRRPMEGEQLVETRGCSSVAFRTRSGSERRPKRAVSEP